MVRAGLLELGNRPMRGRLIGVSKALQIGHAAPHVGAESCRPCMEAAGLHGASTPVSSGATTMHGPGQATASPAQLPLRTTTSTSSPLPQACTAAPSSAANHGPAPSAATAMTPTRDQAAARYDAAGEEGKEECNTKRSASGMSGTQSSETSPSEPSQGSEASGGDSQVGEWGPVAGLSAASRAPAVDPLAAWYSFHYGSRQGFASPLPFGPAATGYYLTGAPPPFPRAPPACQAVRVGCFVRFERPPESDRHRTKLFPNMACRVAAHDRMAFVAVTAASVSFLVQEHLFAWAEQAPQHDLLQTQPWGIAYTSTKLSICLQH